MYRRGRRGVTPPTLTTRSVSQEQPTMTTHKKGHKLEGPFGSRLILSHFALSTVIVAFYRLVQRSIPTCHHRRESTSTSSDGAAGIGVHNSSSSTPNSVIAFTFCSVPVAGQKKCPLRPSGLSRQHHDRWNVAATIIQFVFWLGQMKLGPETVARRLAVWYSQNFLNAAHEADQR